MKYELRELVDGRIRITTPDSRWYGRKLCEGTTDAKWDFVPSVTWIADTGYPKGPEFTRWVAKQGFDEAEAIKSAAGDRGSKVHQAIARLIDGGSVALQTDKFENPRTLQEEELTPEEYFCLMTFCEWFAEERPEVIASETTVWSEKFRYAGTLDLMCRLKSTGYRVVHIVDFKTSPQIWPSMELQLSAYKHADIAIPKGARLGILQVGYKKNKIKKWKYTAIADQFPLFLAARKIWEKECAGIVPLQRDYPMELSLNLPPRKADAQAA